MKIILCVSFLFSSIIFAEHLRLKTCRTPSQKPGLCVSIYACKSFLKTLKQLKAGAYLVDSNRAYIKDSKCGKSGPPHNDLLVCCAKENYCPKELLHHDDLSEGECGEMEDSTRIIGGTEATLGEYPWMALISYKLNGHDNGFNCGGFLISKNHVLTAAHCVVGNSDVIGEPYMVRLGEHDTTSNPDYRTNEGCNEPYQEYKIEKFFVYENYLNKDRIPNKNKLHDIAIIKLEKDVIFSEFRLPLCLPDSVMTENITDKAFVAGWGYTDVLSDSRSDVKMAVGLDIWNQSRCLNIFDGQLCAGGEKGKDSCRGDSGGPLMQFSRKLQKWYAVGIVSYGPTMCGMKNQPGIYTRVPYYLDWIKEKMRSL